MTMARCLSLLLPVFAGFALCTSSGLAAVSNSKGKSLSQTGTASWHAPARNSSASRTASGKRWVASELVAAHRFLPLGTRIAVTHLRNNRSVVVQIIDRGPYVGGRIIDLSHAAASEIGMIGSGTGRVRLDVLPPGALTPLKKAFIAHVTLVRASK